MKNSLLWKAVALFVLVLVLMIPLSMVRATITERAAYQSQVRADVAHSWGGAQELVGPLVVQRYEVPVTAQVWDKNLEAYVEKTHWELRQVLAFPETLAVTGDVTVEERYRGIYSVPVYRADVRMDARLRVPAAPENARRVENLLVMSISDTRGFRQQPVLTVNGRPLETNPGTRTSLKGGVHAVLTDAGESGGTKDVSLQLALSGTDRFAVAPLGGDTTMTLSSNWPHPRFAGGYLPERHEIDDAGFHAEWQTSHYATTVREALSGCAGEADCMLSDTQVISLEMVDPVNVYLLNERSVKYGFLFVLVVFGVFLVFELLKRMRIHPVQYGMVGLGQAIFFLLLLSLSEHVAFGFAYVLGASACILLLAFYVSHVLGAWQRGLVFASLLGSIYAALYVILQSEDHALLLGAMLLFALLAIAMYMTRNVDWYLVGQRSGEGRHNWQQRAGAEGGV